jgi:hypothetical protein
MPLKIPSWWETTNNLFVNDTETNLNLQGNDIQLRGVNYGFNVSSTFKLPEGFVLELSGNFVLTLPIFS